MDQRELDNLRYTVGITEEDVKRLIDLKLLEFRTRAAQEQLLDVNKLNLIRWLYNSGILTEYFPKIEIFIETEEIIDVKE